MWERTLQDLVRGLRANKQDEAKFIAKAVDEIRAEVKSDDMELKAAAILKLTYLDMLGYDMGWASFPIIEVMSSPRFHLKSVGYLAAVQSFHQETDVLMLTTNLLKKDLSSTPADIGVTLNGLSHIATPELARDLSPELLRMLNHSQPHIRQRSVLALYKLVRRYPDLSSSAVDKLRERLEDSDPGVVGATVNVLCEWARHNPQDLLSLAPPLFHLLTTSSNNWMLIKIIKLFGSLSPLEPRLVRKLQPPITELISTTPAISLLYECVHTCIIGGMLQGSGGDSLARTCVSKLSGFLLDSDQNLKYIALLALVKIIPSHPHLISEHHATILSSINDQDISIRMRALDLVSAMVDQSNIQSVIQTFLSHLVADPSAVQQSSAAQALAQYSRPSSPSFATPAIPPSQSPAYRLTLSQRILTMGSQSTYENITNFEWYLSVLVDLAHVANVDVGTQIRDQLVDIVMRVKGVRRYAVRLMYTLLSDDTILRNAQEEGSCSEVLWAAAWICSEYCSEIVEPQKLLPSILQPDISHLHPDIMAVYVQSAMKIFGHWAATIAERWSEEDLPEVKVQVNTIMARMGQFVSSPHIEVQERAANALQLFTLIQADLASYKPRAPISKADANPFAEDTSSSSPALAEPHFPKSLYLIQPLFTAHPLNPVAANAQASVPIPEGLDLDEWFVPPPPPSEPEKKAKKKSKGKEREGITSKSKGAKTSRKQDEDDFSADGYGIQHAEPVESPEEIAERERRKAERLERLKDDPYYIMDSQAGSSSSRHAPMEEQDIDSIPIVSLNDMPRIADVVNPRLASLREFTQNGPSLQEPLVIDKDGEMPAGAVNPAAVPIPSSRQSTPAPSTSNGTPNRITSFQQYDDGSASRSSTPAPEPIKVTRAKKKGTGTGKKKKQT